MRKALTVTEWKQSCAEKTVDKSQISDVEGQEQEQDIHIEDKNNVPEKIYLQSFL